MRETPPNQGSTTIPREIWVPALLLTFVCLIFMMVAFFQKTLTDDQRPIVNGLFAVLAGAATFFIGGSAFIRFTGNLAGVKVLFTGTAGVAIMVFTLLHPLFDKSQKKQDRDKQIESTRIQTSTPTPYPTTVPNTGPESPQKAVHVATFAISGSFQQGYKYSDDSTVSFNSYTGLQVAAKITVLGPNSREEFTGEPNYMTDSMWQWQNQGSLNGSLDLREQRRTFGDQYTGGRLSHAAYWNPTLNHNITSTDTTLTPVPGLSR